MPTELATHARIRKLERENCRLQQYLSIAGAIVVVIHADQRVAFMVDSIPRHETTFIFTLPKTPQDHEPSQELCS